MTALCGQNVDMNTIEIISTEGDAIIEHVLSGKPLDPELARRIRERSEHATEELRRKYGTLDVAVGLIRDVREDE